MEYSISPSPPSRLGIWQEAVTLLSPKQDLLAGEKTHVEELFLPYFTLPSMYSVLLVLRHFLTPQLYEFSSIALQHEYQ